MKKFMYCACVAALATACTSEDLIQENVATKSKGIVFEATIPAGVIETRGEMTQKNPGSGAWNFFWYAEQDRINVYADQVEEAGTNLSKLGVVDTWGTIPTPAIYKATKSQSEGQFTAQDDDNWIAFKNSGKNAVTSNFVLTYPTTTTVTGATTTTSYPNKVIAVKLNIGVGNAAQTVKYNETVAPMYSITQGKANKAYESVGEIVPVDFYRPFPVARFSSSAGNDEYNQYLGELNSITMKTTGEITDGTPQPATSIAYAAGTEFEKNAEGVWEPATTGTSTVKVSLSEIKEWNSADQVFMSIAPVKREKTVDGEVVKYPEGIEVTYEYQNVSLTKELKTSNPWNLEHGILPMPTLDIATDFPYIVTNSGRTLIVFSGKFNNIFDNSNKIIWKSESDGTVELNEITTIISNVELSNDELKKLKLFTNLTSLELAENTSICENVFKGSLGTNLTTLKLPKVTSIAAKYNNGDYAQDAFVALNTLDLSSYKFDQDNGAENLFFNDNVKTTLETLNIAAVEDFMVSFGYDYYMSFEGYANLNEITLNAEQVSLLGSAFKGCTSLTKVTGKVDLTNAPNAFEGANQLKTINVTGTVIPKEAFKNATAIEEILLDGVQVAPTEIQEQAFYNATSLKLMDLSQAATIGKRAFLGASAFIGSDATNNYVVDVAAEFIANQTFEGTAIKRIQFHNATTLGSSILANCAKLEQIKFLKVFAADENLTPGQHPFAKGSSTPTVFNNIALFVNTAQTGINGYALTCGDVETKFKVIKKENDPWTK